jgi:glycine hydroxymethyltransferase
MTIFNTVADVDACLYMHNAWRGQCLNMIASENIASPTVRRFLASDLGGRYPTYGDDPLERNYLGQHFVAEIETGAQDVAREIYQADFVDFRPLGGEIAGVGVILGLANPGETIMETGDGFGGQRVATKLLTANMLKDLFKVEYIPYNPETHDIDVAGLIERMTRLKPKLVILGRSHILFPETIQPLREVADAIGAYLAYDFSHISGLVTGKTFPNPLDLGVDVVMGGHTKSLPGPQGGLFFTRNEDVYRKVRRGLYPPIVCNHHVARTPALAALYLEMRAFGQAYAVQVGKNSAALGAALANVGLGSQYPELGYSRSHQVLVDVSPYGDGKEVAKMLESANIICGPGSIPRPTWAQDGTARTGLRLGTQELTRIGMTPPDMTIVAGFMKRVIVDREPSERVVHEIAEFVGAFTELKFCFDTGVHPYKPLFSDHS